MKIELIDDNVTSPESVSYIEDVTFNEPNLYNKRNKGQLKVLGSIMAATICTIVPSTIDARQLTPYNTSIEGLISLENSIEIEPDYRLLQELHTNINNNSLSSFSLSEENPSLNQKTGDFDTEITLPIKKTLILRAKVKSISKFIPKPFLD
jgi:hypothetical protein